jgi:hypothetical protein
MKVYLAGPMRNIDKFNFPAFDEAAARLRAMGHDVINPADLDREHGFDENNPAFVPDDAFMRTAIARDLVAIASCEALALLPGWRKSAGTKVELTLARFLCLQILDATTGEAMPDEPITAEAQRITTRDRRDVYGHPIEDFTRIGKMWEGLLGVPVTPEQVAGCMILVKLGRLRHSPWHRDSLVDIAGYANCWDMIRQKKAEVGL